MRRLAGIAAIIFTISGCTTVNVNKVESSKHQIKVVCIEENPKVLVVDFISVVERGFLRHGIETKVYAGNAPSDCGYTLTYTALRGWDFAPFLRYAELRLKYDGKTIGTATYQHSGGFALNKWASTESKMMPVVDQLLSDFKPNY